ncbi:MAG: glycine betaine/L-proline ABC transporter ATP-binding protein [Acidibacillus sp.]|nr:glycine betaine/L-proline ABC transporter ATP-binding protein [Acidibacillus sp.]
MIEVRELTKLFGVHTHHALKLLKEEQSKEDIQRQTGSTVGVDRATFDVKEGELFVVMGLSGSGKSTLLRCMNRLIEPTSGKIVVHGEEITALDHHALLTFRQRYMAMVFQKFALLPHRTVEENVAFGLELQGMNKINRIAIAQEKLKLVGLQGWEKYYPTSLSGGMQQRVGLARALANDPDILLMDEAFSALDPLIREDMQNELLRLQKQLHKTILFVTHDLNEALRLGDRIALMKDGHIVQIGTPEQIINEPTNEYVARFVKGVDVTKILTAKHAMKPVDPLLQKRDDPYVGLQVVRNSGLSSGFVVDEHHHFLGIVTVDQLLLAVSKKQRSLNHMTFIQAGSIDPAMPLGDVISLIVTSTYPLAVVNKQHMLCGMVDKDSILDTLADTGGDYDFPQTSISTLG